MLAELIYSLLAAVLGVWLLYRVNSSRLRRMALQFPGPKSWPLLGDVYYMTRMRASPYVAFQCMQRYQREFGDLCRVWMGSLLVVWLSTGVSLEVVLSSSKTIEKGYYYHFLRPWLGNGLVTAPGKKWRPRRKIITPAFHFNILEDFVKTFDTNGRILVEKLKSKVGQPEFDVSHYVTLCTLDVICESAMGVHMNAQQDSESEYVKAVKTVTKCIVVRSFSPWLYPDFLYGLTATGREEKRSLRMLHDMTYKVIRRRREMLQSTDQQPEEAGEDGQKRRLAFLDLLLQYSQEGAGLSDEDIREEVDTFMFEGHDTTTSAISFAMYCLAHHPNVQEKAVKEVKDVFGDSDRAVTYQDIQDMKYLELIIKETLRMFPSVPGIGRELTEDLVIDNKTIPAGATITMFVYGAQRDPKVFAEPNKFHPERFLQDNGQERAPYSYVPFSAGPRNCIGQRFAMLEMKATLSRILRSFRILPGNGSFEETEKSLTWEIILKMVDGVNIRLEAR